jgi:hypothetical protein
LGNRSVITYVVVLNQLLTIIELFGVLIRFVNPLLYVFGVLSNLLIVIYIAEILKVAGQSFELTDSIIEVLFVILHLLDELLLFFIEEALLLFDPLNGFHRSTIDTPHLIILFTIWKFVMEGVKCGIYVHALLNVHLLLLHFSWKTDHNFLDCGQFFNVLWNLLNLMIIQLKLLK